VGDPLGVRCRDVVAESPRPHHSVCAERIPCRRVLAAFIGGLLLPNWQALFMVFGAAALIPAAYVLMFIPESTLWKAARVAAVSPQGGPPERASLTEIFRRPLLRQTIFGTLAAIFALFAYIGLLTWLPSYLVNDRGLPVTVVAQYLVVFNAGVFLSYFLFGWIADIIGKRIALVISLALATVLLLAYTVVPDVGVLRWFGGLLGLSIVFSSLMGSYFSEIYPIRVRTTGAGFCFNVGRLVASFSPFLLAGVVADIGYSGALVLAACIFALSAVAMLFMPKAAESPWRR
jgi:sugar phosphate permease